MQSAQWSSDVYPFSEEEMETQGSQLARSRAQARRCPVAGTPDLWELGPSSTPSTLTTQQKNQAQWVRVSKNVFKVHEDSAHSPFRGLTRRTN